MIDAPPLSLGPAGLRYLFLVALLLPWAVLKSGRRARSRPPPARTPYFLGALQTALVLGVLSLIVAHLEQVELFPAIWPTLGDAALGLGAALVLWLGMAPVRAGIARRRERRMQLFCEPTRSERWLWTLVSLSAGFWEELVYRGVTTTLFARLTGSVPAAVALSLAAFALGHLHRGWFATVPVAVIGFVFHAFVFRTGALYVSMGIHFLYDLGAGFAYMRLASKHGITRETAPARATD